MLDLLKAKKESLLKEICDVDSSIKELAHVKKLIEDKIGVIDELIAEENAKNIPCEPEAEVSERYIPDPLVEPKVLDCPEEAVEQKDSTILIRYGNEI